MRLYMPRFFTGSMDGNLECLRRDAEEAAQAGSDIVLFPEMFLSGYLGENSPQEFLQAFEEISARHAGVTFMFGSISQGRRNRAYAFRNGAQLGYYDKVHLFLPNGEDKLWESGDEYVAVDDGNCRIGLAVCNDVRFPEQLRSLKLRFDIQLAVLPALWPWRRDHIWSALLRARAIENGIFVAGCCIAGIDNGAEKFDGAGNHLFDPNGKELFDDDRVYEFDLNAVTQPLVDTRRQYVDVENFRLYQS